MSKKISPNVIPAKNVGKTAGKHGPTLLPTKSEQQRDHPTVIKALGELTRHFKK
jgi:hypothetical protein